jgi:RNA-directed DNA polymerase
VSSRATNNARGAKGPCGGSVGSASTRIALLNPVLRGWGAYFRTGNAATQFGQVDDYAVRRLKRLLLQRHGRNLRAGQADLWTPDYFHALGLCRLRGTIRYPEAA